MLLVDSKVVAANFHQLLLFLLLMMLLLRLDIITRCLLMREAGIRPPKWSLLDRGIPPVRCRQPAGRKTPTKGRPLNSKDSTFCSLIFGVRTEEGNYSFVFRKNFFFVTMRCVLVRAWMLDWGLPLNDKETTNRNDINTQTNDPLPPSPSLCLCLCLCLSVFLSVFLSVYLSVCLSVCLSSCVCICRCVCVCVWFYVFMSVSCMCGCLCFCLSFCIRECVYLSVS